MRHQRLLNKKKNHLIKLPKKKEKEGIEQQIFSRSPRTHPTHPGGSQIPFFPESHAASYLIQWLQLKLSCHFQHSILKQNEWGTHKWYAHHKLRNMVIMTLRFFRCCCCYCYNLIVLSSCATMYAAAVCLSFIIFILTNTSQRIASDSLFSASPCSRS